MNLICFKSNNIWSVALLRLSIIVSLLKCRFFSTFRYSVMAGTPAKMVEYLLETRIDKTCSFDGKNYLCHCAVEISYNTSARESAELIKQRYVFLCSLQNSVK